MSWEAYIGRRSAIWLWKETTAGTKVSAQVWIPKESGTLNPSFETAQDTSWYGVIDEVYDTFTTKNFSNITLTGIVRDDFIGYLLLGALWKYTKLYCVTGTPSWWTPARWDITTWNSAVLKKIIVIGETTYYFFDKAVTGSITNGTWTMTATAVNVNAHMFERLNSNNHPTFTIYDDDPVASAYAPYCMINSFELSCEVADYVKFSAEFQGKQMQDNTDTLNPAYSDEAPFTASMAGVSFATNESWLNTATTVCMQNFRLTINKNLTDIQCFGSTDVDSLHNQQFTLDWDFEALFSSTTLRDWVINSEKKAIRFYAENKNASELVSWIYPSIYVDCMKVWLTEWTKTDDNNGITKQTLWFSWQYDNASGTSIEVVLLNSNSTWY